NIKAVFQSFGFQEIETPAMENLSTLLGKYGEEGDKLLFKVLNSGDYLRGIEPKELQQAEYNKLITRISEKGLRYDLTVPFARFVVQHQNELTFPFKRFQIQPVWRADRPQSGRYREFYQCDVDVVGSNSLLNEVELIQIVEAIYTNLNIKVVLKLNNRKILSGIAEIIGQSDKIVDITVAIDKFDKIGLEGVNKELAEKEIAPEAIAKLQPIILLTGTNAEKIAQLHDVLASSETGMKGLDEIETILNYTGALGIKQEIELDLSLARGLNYYTGAIFEVKALDFQIGSITGGGRYDDLTGIFGLNNVSGVGISFGADRIYDVMTNLELFPADILQSTKLLFVNFGQKEELFCLNLLSILRKAGVPCEIFPDSAKMKKQMNYADKKSIPYVAIVGETEINEGYVTIKNMQSGEQRNIATQDILNFAF
ncbi:MAG: hypothetical protein RIS47_1182, partial [Bacteroidota bacterium]